MSTILVRPGGLVIKDPADLKVYQFDWDTENLAAAAIISTSTFTITVIKGANTTALTKDSESLITGNRNTQLRLTGGTVGTVYEIANKIVTNETPAQTKERSFRVLIENR